MYFKDYYRSVLSKIHSYYNYEHNINIEGNENNLQSYIQNIAIKKIIKLN